MTDPTAPAAAPVAAPAPPITVKATAAPIITSQTFQVLVVAGCAFLADRLMHSDVAIAAVVPVGALVATWAWSLLHRLHSWRALRFLAARAPDTVAVVGRRPWWEFWS